VTAYQTLPSGPPIPPANRIAYRDRWPDDDLSRLRSLLWWRLQLKIAATDAVALNVLDEVDRMARQYRRDGEKLHRKPEGRSWGRWLIQVSRELTRWTRTLRRARERA